MKELLKKGIFIYMAALTVMTIALFVIVGFSVFTRYCLNSSLGWSDELSRFLFIWITFLGAAYAYGVNEHIGLDFVVNRIGSPRKQVLVRLLGELVIGVVLFVITRFGFNVALSATNRSPAMGIPMTWIYMVVPGSGAIMMVQNVIKIVHWLKMLGKAAPAPQRGR